MLEIKRKKSEAISNTFLRAGAAGETKQFKELPAVLLAIAIIAEDGVEKIEFLEVGYGVLGVREEGGDGPGVLGFLLFRIEERTKGFSALAGSQR